MTRVIKIRLDSPCDNDCIFCFSKRGETDYTEYTKQVEKASKEEKDGIIIVGGEPTMREDLVDMVSFAKEKGFKKITLFTNARPLSNKNYAETLIKAGVSDFVVLVWGPTEKIHDTITRTEGSFKETVEGIKNIVLIKGGEVILGKTGILMENYKHLPELAEFFSELGIKWMNFELPPVEDSCISLTPDVMEYVFKAIETANNLGTYLGIENIPFCTMKGYEDYVRPFVWRKATVEDSGFLDFVFPIHLEGRTKPVHCNPCRYFPVCDGIWNPYLKGDHFKANPVEKIEEKRPFITIDDVKDNVDVFYPLVKGEIPDIQADAIVHYSGGTDSTVSTALYARKNKDKKVVLITYQHPGLLNISSSRINAHHLIEKYPNVVAHLYVPVLEELYIPLCFGKDYQDNVTQLQANYGCVACKILMYAYSTYLHKAYFKGDTILSGNNLSRVPGRGGPPTPQTPAIVSLIKDFVGEYGMKCINPIYAVTNKQRTVFIAKELGLSTTRAFQSTCTYGIPVPIKDINVLIQFLNERITPLVRDVLEINLKK
jgi:MoaA/NifB/PqqE/SkfB family radical SAM enzyme/PP-loop superfamily ATP-utilizing enzyme